MSHISHLGSSPKPLHHSMSQRAIPTLHPSIVQIIDSHIFIQNVVSLCIKICQDYSALHLVKETIADFSLLVSNNFVSLWPEDTKYSLAQTGDLFWRILKYRVPNISEKHPNLERKCYLSYFIINHRI